jgi:hypothetical protein
MVSGNSQHFEERKRCLKQGEGGSRKKEQRKREGMRKECEYGNKRDERKSNGYKREGNELRHGIKRKKNKVRKI